MEREPRKRGISPTEIARALARSKAGRGILVAALLGGSSLPAFGAETPTPTPRPKETPTATATATATATRMPEATKTPTVTPRPTEKPKPTATPRKLEQTVSQETLNYREDIVVDWVDVDPQNPGRILAVVRPGSLPSFPARTYVSTYHPTGPTNERFTWQTIGDPFVGVDIDLITISPNNPNLWIVGGNASTNWLENKWLLKITRNNGQSFQEITAPSDLGAVERGGNISKNGDTLYVLANNSEGTAGKVAKFDLVTGTRLAAANNGWTSGEFGGHLLASSNDNETVYAGGWLIPSILRTRDGAQNWQIWESLPDPPNADAVRVVSHQGKDTALVSGNGWLKIKKEGESTIFINTAVFRFSSGFRTLAADTTGPELKIYGAWSTRWIAVGSTTQSSWHEFSNAGLPSGKSVVFLKFFVTPEGKKWLTLALYDPIDDLTKDSAFWFYDLEQGETGTWRQQARGLMELFTLHIPVLFKGYAGGW